MKITKVYKEIYSAFKRIPRVLNSIVNLCNNNIIISDVSRFSRSVSIGTDLARIAIKNKNTLIFIHEKLICSKISHLRLLAKYLRQSEQESITISTRVRNSKQYLSARGIYLGGGIPYGYMVRGRRIIKSLCEQKIIKFINLCRTPNVTAATLSKNMKNIALSNDYNPIICYDELGNIVSKITNRLTYKEIANLLNSYMIRKRDLKWTPTNVKNAILKSDQNNLDNSNKKRKNDNYENIKYLNPDGVGFIFPNTSDMSKKYKTEPILSTSPKPPESDTTIYKQETVTDLCLLEEFIKFRELSSA